MCMIDGCAKPAKSRGMCSMHYERWRLKGDALAPTKPYRPYGQRGPFPRPDGYIEVYEPEHPLARSDGRVMIHRKIAWDTGLLTDPSLEVHHRNGDKTDNRPQNLEVLSTAEHARRHLAERGMVTNQYGTFALRGRS